MIAADSLTTPDNYRDLKPTQMNTLSQCINKLIEDGFVNSLHVKGELLFPDLGSKGYAPNEVNIINYYRFEGETNPSDSSILFAIETSDGLKGVLLDAYGVYADEEINNFMRQVNNLSKMRGRRPSKEV